MNLLQTVYFKAPYAAKCWMASLRAQFHNQWRFAEAYEQHKERIRQRSSWSSHQFSAYQVERLRMLLEHCARHVPYYRDLFDRTGFDWRSFSEIGQLRELPILSKSTLRHCGEHLLDERLSRRELAVGRSSGTTGASVAVYRSQSEFSAAFAYNAVRLWAIAGVERSRQISASFGSSLVADPGRSRPPFWVYNRTWKQLYFSVFHMSDTTMDSYLDALERYGVEYLEGYPSAIATLAEYALRVGRSIAPMKAVFTTAEQLFPYQRQAISTAFQCRVYNQYGCVEQVVNATECKYGSMHINPDHSVVEIVGSDGEPLPPGEIGEVVGTSLERFAQPLLRYRTGDLAAFAATACPCGSGRPVLQEISGRSDDMLVTSDGRRISQLISFSIFSDLSGMRESQIVQTGLDSFIIRLVPNGQYNADAGRAAVQRLKQRVGASANIELHLVERIERTSAGKVRTVVNLMANDPRETTH